MVPTPCRDIKSSNILLSAEGVAKVADVGLAKVLVDGKQQTVDQMGGTFDYAAPELIMGFSCTVKVCRTLPRAHENVPYNLKHVRRPSGERHWSLICQDASFSLCTVQHPSDPLHSIFFKENMLQCS